MSLTRNFLYILFEISRRVTSHFTSKPILTCAVLKRAICLFCFYLVRSFKEIVDLDKSLFTVSNSRNEKYYRHAHYFKKK